MTFKLGAVSRANLQEVHPDLARVVKRAIELTTVDFKVIEGSRSDARAYELWGKGRSSAQCAVAGCPVKYARPGDDKVTWLKNPLNSKHRLQSDGYAHAVDLLPDPYDWKIDKVTKEPFMSVYRAMFAAAKELGVTIRWGADWDRDNNTHEKGEGDNPHFELVRAA